MITNIMRLLGIVQNYSYWRFPAFSHVYMDCLKAHDIYLVVYVVHISCGIHVYSTESQYTMYCIFFVNMFCKIVPF